MPSFPHTLYPLTARIGFPGSTAEHSSRTMNEQCSQVSVAAFADTEQSSFSAA
tara:strand:- start:14 stop:172 length:159 start_codon:yes stop_codon:yes gene_type:complete